MDRNSLDDTCLKWGADGELSPVDQQRILQRLMAQDPAAQGLRDHFGYAVLGFAGYGD